MFVFGCCLCKFASQWCPLFPGWFRYLNATAAAGPTVQGIDAQGMQSIRSAIELFGGDDFDTKMRLLYGSGNETEEGEDETDNTPCAAKRVKKQ